MQTPNAMDALSFIDRALGDIQTTRTEHSALAQAVAIVRAELQTIEGLNAVLAHYQSNQPEGD